MIGTPLARPTTRLLWAAAALAMGLTACSSNSESGSSAVSATQPGLERAATRRVWRPRPGVSWQIQLQGRVDARVDADVFDIDGADTPASLVRRLHNRGRRVICYFSAGTYESFRRDRRLIPPGVRGKRVDGFPDERWLDVRKIETLRPVIESRLATCRRKGFDAVDFDNVDGYANDTGFRLLAANQLRYNHFLAAAAHRRGMAAGLKNDLGQIPRLVRDFEFQINEQCFEFNECRKLLPFIDRGKAVFHIEYARRPARFCPKARRYRFSSVFKRLDLRAFRVAC